MRQGSGSLALARYACSMLAAAGGKGSAQAAQVQQAQRASSPGNPRATFGPMPRQSPLSPSSLHWHGSRHQTAVFASAPLESLLPALAWQPKSER